MPSEEKLNQLKEILEDMDRPTAERIGDGIIAGVMQVLPGGAAFDAAVTQQIEKANLEADLTTIIQTIMEISKDQQSSDGVIDNLKGLIVHLSHELSKLAPPKAHPLSANALNICRWVVSESKYGFAGNSRSDWIMLSEISSRFGLSEDASIEATDELKLSDYAVANTFCNHDDSILITNKMFWDFDKELGAGYDTISNARLIAHELTKSRVSFLITEDIFNQYGLEPRRLNPALTFLVENNFAKGERSGRPFLTYDVIYPTFTTRKFAKENPEV
jgi:hypothetical protein